MNFLFASKVDESLDIICRSINGISITRSLIFNLATSGKLAPQLVHEKHPQDLLKSIIKEETAHENISSWLRIDLKNCAEIYNGNSTSSTEKAVMKQNQEGLNYIATKDVSYGFQPIDYNTGLRIGSKSNNFKIAPKNSILICLEGGSAGKKMGLVNQEIAFGNKLFAVVCKNWIDPNYLLTYFLSSRFQMDFKAQMSGIIGGISKAKFSSLQIPVPPLEEQKRIVVKIKELMNVCDGLETQLALSNSFKIGVRKSFIDVITSAQSQEELRSAWKGIQNNWEVITGNGEGIDSLRSLILELAVKGQLTKGVVEYGDWGSLPLKEACSYIQRGKSPSYSNVGSCKVVSQKCVKWSGFDDDPARFIEESSLPSYSTERFLQDGDLLWNSTGTGTVGRTAIFSEDKSELRFVADSHVTVLRTSKLDKKFFYFWSRSPDVQRIVSNSTTGSTNQQELNLTVLKELVISFPDLDEQKKMVRKIELLLEACDQFEFKMKENESIIEKFAKSVVSWSA